MTRGPRKGLQGKLPFLINCYLVHKVLVGADFITVEGIVVEPREKVERAVNVISDV